MLLLKAALSSRRREVARAAHKREQTNLGDFNTIPNFLFLFALIFSLYSLSTGVVLSCIPQHWQKTFLAIK
jgi:hypothetical protein